MYQVIVKTFEGMVKIPFGNDEKFATDYAKSFGTVQGIKIAEIEQI